MTHKVNDHGLSEVIGFVLILALVIVAISLWMTYVLPAQGREQEISHMDYVGDWFLDYKIAVDSLWMNSETGVTDSTTLTLGSKGGNTQTSGLFLPMMQPIGSSGSLAINNTPYNTLDTITVTTNNDPNSLPIPMSSLVYQSNNNYWIQQQYYYQMGGIFLSQDINGVTGVTNVVSPLISIYNVSNTASVVVVPINLNGGGSIAGEGNARLNFRLQEQPDSPVTNPNTWVNISVKVKDAQTALMWRNLFRDIVIRERINGSDTGVYQWYTLCPLSTTDNGIAWIKIQPPVGTNVNLVMTRPYFFTSLNSITLV